MANFLKDKIKSFGEKLETQIAPMKDSLLQTTTTPTKDGTAPNQVASPQSKQEVILVQCI